MDLLFFVTLTSVWLFSSADFDALNKVHDTALKHRAFDRASTEVSCSNKFIEDREGVIVSPEYPETYPNHVSCTWHIVGKSGEIITLMFNDLDIEETGSCEKPPCCMFNWVKVGPSYNGSERAYCGQNVSYHPTFVSNFNKVIIKFHISNVVDGGRGFKLFYYVGRRRIPCDENSFHCASGECLDQTVRCNRKTDCKDGSDERYCSDMCPNQRSCRSVFFCYDDKRHCDGVHDCPDYSDEIDCGVCPVNETLCDDGSDKCYNPITQRCNRIMDCLNGVDEKDCLHECPGEIMCASGTGCYVPEERCNGIAQCTDSSDEKNCGADLCNYDRGGFLCANRHCIREVWKCDRTNDCGDGSDEYNCLRNSVLTAAVMGSLICALLLVIAISCTCRLYALRALENQMSSRENMLSRLNQEFLFREPPPPYAIAVGDHARSLCVENVHYNTAPRRGRRRPRRARRLHEMRRPSLSIVDNMIHQNCIISRPQLNFPFPCLPVMPRPVESSSSQSATRNSCCDFTSSTGLSITSSEFDEPLDTGQEAQENFEIHCTDQIMTETNQKKNNKSQNSSDELTLDAESSFSELSNVHRKEGSVAEGFEKGNLVTDCNTCLSVDLEALSPPSNHASEDTVEDSHSSCNFCDSNDMQPLIT